MPALTIKDLRYKHNQRMILQNVQLTLAPSKIVGLLGENGAGKTTLMRLITGSAKGQGSIVINGATTAVARKQQVSFTDHLTGFSAGMK